MMGPIEEAQREKFFPVLLGGEEINANFRQILGHSVKHGGLGIPDPRSSSKSAYNTSKAVIRELIGSLLGGTDRNYVGHRACVRKAIQTARHSKTCVDLGEVARRKELAGGQERNRLHRSTRNAAWLSAIPRRLNGTELSQEEFWDNIRLRYGLMPKEIPTNCDGFGKKFSIDHSI